MNKISKITALLLIALLTISSFTLIIQAQISLFTLSSDDAVVSQTDSAYTLTYPHSTTTATFSLKSAEGVTCSVYTDAQCTQLLSLTSKKYKVKTYGKYTYLYIRTFDGAEHKDFTLTLITPAKSIMFNDYTSVAVWAQPYVDYCNRSGLGIVEGDESGNLNPTASLTRNEMAVIATRMLGVNSNLYKNDSLPYKDRIASWAKPAAAALTKLGIMDGALHNGVLVFDGNSKITREQVAKIMVNVALLSNGNTTTAEKIYNENKQQLVGAMSTYADNDDISSWAKPYMAVAVQHLTLLEGEKIDNKSYLHPKRNISRQEMITMVARQKGYNITETLSMLIEDGSLDISNASDSINPKLVDLNTSLSNAISALQYGNAKEQKAAFIDLFEKYCAFKQNLLIYLSPERRKSNSYTGVNTNESDQMYAIANLMKPMLESLGYNVFIADINVDIYDSSELANQMGADLYVALHSNALSGSNNGSAQGSVIFHSNNPGSRELAKKIDAQLSKLTPTVDNGIKNDSLERLPYAEIRLPTMANVLIEVEFHDYPAYAQWIVNNKKDIASAIVTGIRKYINSL
ncbi:MAG: N-acetylmuramoyl-L-alanine amidase [Clostridia bacterium]|nr:N-acetylmuramoyl-L-alanine amidase [Clostridia bacterium]